MSSRILIIFSVLSMMNIAHSTEKTKSMCTINICTNYQSTVNYHCGRTGNPWGYYKNTSQLCADESCSEPDCYCPCQADPLQSQYEEWEIKRKSDPYNNYFDSQMTLNNRNEIEAVTCGLVIPGREGNGEFWKEEPPRCKLSIIKTLLDKKQIETFVFEYVLLQIGITQQANMNMFADVQKQISELSSDGQSEKIKSKLKLEIKNEILDELSKKLELNKPLSDALKEALNKK